MHKRRRLLQDHPEIEQGAAGWNDLPDEIWDLVLEWLWMCDALHLFGLNRHWNDRFKKTIPLIGGTIVRWDDMKSETAAILERKLRLFSYHCIQHDGYKAPPWTWELQTRAVEFGSSRALGKHQEGLIIAPWSGLREVNLQLPYWTYLDWSPLTQTCPLESMILRNLSFNTMSILHLKWPEKLKHLSIEGAGDREQMQSALSRFTHLQSVRFDFGRGWTEFSLPDWSRLKSLDIHVSTPILLHLTPRRWISLKRMNLTGQVHPGLALNRPLETLQISTRVWSRLETPHLCFAKQVHFIQVDHSVVWSQLEQMPHLKTLILDCRNHESLNRLISVPRYEFKEAKWHWHFWGAWGPRLSEIESICPPSALEQQRVSVENLTLTDLSWLGNDPPKPPKNWYSYLKKLSQVQIHTLVMPNQDRGARVSFCDLVPFVPSPIRVQNIKTHWLISQMELNAYNVDAFEKIFPDATFNDQSPELYRR